MDNEFMPPDEHGPGETPPQPSDAAAPVDAASIIEQVRELLFGDQRRATEGAIKGLEDRLAAVEARFAELERRLHEVRAEASAAHVSGVEAIGSALSELGDKIKGLIPRSPQ